MGQASRTRRSASAASLALAACVAVASSSSVLGACGEPEDPTPPAKSAPYTGPPIPWAYAPFPEVPVPADNPLSDAKVALGNALFYDPILSSDHQVACATCHSEQWGMSDGLPVSVGVDGKGPTGPGRTGPNTTTRNAPTIWNAAFRKELFLDGRSPSLEDQALKPLMQAKEMNRPPDQAVLDLRKVPAYVAMFRAAFPDEPDPVTPRTLAMALATLERTVVSKHAPYDQYVAGDAGALSDLEKTGMNVFAKAGCPTCHVPPLFEAQRYDERFQSGDDGRFAVTQNEADRGAFRVPTLRNLRETGPYFHDGSVVTMEDAIQAEVEVQVARGLSPELGADELAALDKFLKSSLMDRSLEPHRPARVPSGLDVPADGFRIPR
jgi:cytochrome c peroxidase